jgi:PAS domain S-box-containing protein
MWNLSNSVTGILAEDHPPQEAIERVVQLIGETLAFDCGSFFVVQEARVVLRCLSFWTAQSEAFPNFELVTRVREFAAGDGLPGTVWVKREPIWHQDVSTEQNFPRASVAKMDGIRTGVAFPVVAGKRVLGVFEFFSRKGEECQQELLQFLKALGVQIAVFLKHYRMAENITQSEAEMRLIAESSKDAVFTINENSEVLFANHAVSEVFGWRPEEVIGKKLTVIMPEYLRHIHEQGIRRYTQTGRRHLNWDEILLPGLHKNGEEIPLRLAFGEFWRGGSRVFTGFATRREELSSR